MIASFALLNFINHMDDLLNSCYLSHYVTSKWQIDGWIIMDGAYHVKIDEYERRYIATVADSKMQLYNNVIWHNPQSANLVYPSIFVVVNW